MSLDLILTGVSLAWQAWEAYEKIDGAPDEVASVAVTIKSMKGYLEDVKRLIQKHKPKFSSIQVIKIDDIVKNANTVSGEAAALFKKWDNEAGAAPGGLKWRYDKVAKVWFTLGGSMGDLKELEQKAKSRCSELDQVLNVINTEILIRMQKKLDDFLLVPPSPGPSGPTGPTNPKGKGPKKPPSPSPMPKRSDIRILIVDPSNRGRGRVAESLLLLMGTWTVCTGGRWKISTAHSAGFFLREKSDVIDIIENMNLLHGHDVKVTQGGKPASPVAMEALFDNNAYKHPLKEKIKEKVASETSRGLSRNAFKNYDYLIAFTEREHENLIRLKGQLMASYGSKIAPAGKGRVLHLGSYLSRQAGKGPVEMIDPRPATREKWNAKVAQIKFALKQFLRKELGWEQWKPGAKVERWEEVIKWAV
ncbi:hypothetical protein MKZ38_004087 [Zalerion maritima]|uniref:Prion-inhibition and propagation HeLo domain-containing protein n=1 Tax=Zalerion maritima TaxID=339359 RepID=A0AAD5S4G5_9PEZI|nr:hypothetical protein MKZ38_004087 [Zalerion maritima]